LSEGDVCGNAQARHALSRVGRTKIPRAALTLRRPLEFEAVLRSGSRFASRNFVVRANLNSGSHARLGIIAGRKVAPRAVDRNRARRLIREVFRGALGKLGPYDLTVQLRGNLRGERNENVRKELEKLLESVVRLAPAESPPVRP
jgi:ribonuclease P protein component